MDYKHSNTSRLPNALGNTFSPYTIAVSKADNANKNKLMDERIREIIHKIPDQEWTTRVRESSRRVEREEIQDDFKVEKKTIELGRTGKRQQLERLRPTRQGESVWVQALVTYDVWVPEENKTKFMQEPIDKTLSRDVQKALREEKKIMRKDAQEQYDAGFDKAYYKQVSRYMPPQKFEIGPGTNKEDILRKAIKNFLRGLEQHVNSSDFFVSKIEKPSFIYASSNTDLATLPLRGSMLKYRELLGSLPEFREGFCAEDYIVNELFDKDGYKSKNVREMVRKFFTRDQETEPVYNTLRIIEFAKTQKNVSVIAIDPMDQILDFYKVKDPVARIYYKIGDEHCSAIRDEDLRLRLSRGKNLFGEHIFKVTFGPGDYAVYNYDEVKSYDKIKECTKRVILVRNCEDVSEIFAVVRLAVNQSILFYDFNQRKQITGFQDPETGKFILAARDYDDVLEICKTLSEKIKTIKEFEFHNQSVALLGMDLFRSFAGENFVDSFYPSDYLASVNHERHVALIWDNPKEIKDLHNARSIDKAKAYSSRLLKNDTPWPVFSAVTDKFVPFSTEMFDGNDRLRVGVYKLNIRPMLCGGQVPLVGDCFDSTTVDFLLKWKLIKVENIKYGMLANVCLPADMFKLFVSKAYEILPERLAKNLINKFIGLLGRRYETKCRLAATQSLDIWNWFIEEEMKRGVEEPAYIFVNDMYILRRDIQVEKTRGHLPIYQRIVEGTSCEMHALFEKYKSEKSELVCIKTDCITLTHLSKYPEPNQEPIGGDRLEGALKLLMITPPACPQWNPWVPPKREWKIYETNDIGDAATKFCGDYNQIACVIGLGGYGKSELMKQLILGYIEEKIPVKLFTSVNMVKSKFTVELKDPEIARTLESALNTGGTPSNPEAESGRLPNKEEVLKYLDVFKRLANGVVFVDEISNICTRHWGMLSHVKTRFPEMGMMLSGDPENQNMPIDTVYQGCVNALESPLVFDLCQGNLIRMTYNPEKSRYDKKLHDFVELFLRHNRIPEGVNPFDPKDESRLGPTMCIGKYSNYNNLESTRNNEMNRAFLANNPKATRYEFFNTKIISGTPVFANINEKTAEDSPISRSERFYFMGIDPNGQVILKRANGDETIHRSASYFARFFSLGFYATSHKIQGQTIAEPFEIADITSMNRREFFTAITRAKTLSQISYQSRYVGWKLNEPGFIPGKILEQTEIDQRYLKAIIYLIFNETLKVLYVGQTCQTKEDRFEGHKEHPTNKAIAENKMMIHKDTQIIEIEKWPCLTQVCILEREQYQIRLHRDMTMDSKSKYFGWKLMNVMCNDKKKASRYEEKRKVEMKVEVQEVKQVLKSLPWKIEHTPRYRTFYWCLGQRKKDEESITKYEKGKAGEGLAEIKRKRLERAQRQFGTEYTYVFPEDPAI